MRKGCVFDLSALSERSSWNNVTNVGCCL